MTDRPVIVIKVKYQLILLVVLIINSNMKAKCDDTELLYAVSRPPRFYAILTDHRKEPMSIQLSEEYMDKDYFITTNKNGLDGDDLDDDTEEVFEEKDKDIRVLAKSMDGQNQQL